MLLRVFYFAAAFGCLIAHPTGDNGLGPNLKNATVPLTKVSTPIIALGNSSDSGGNITSPTPPSIIPTVVPPDHDRSTKGIPTTTSKTTTEVTSTPPTTTTTTTTTTSTVKPSTTQIPDNSSTITTPVTIPPITNPITSTTPAPSQPSPHNRNSFNGPSFIGGILLALGIVAIGFVGWKYHKARNERNYRTL